MIVLNLEPLLNTYGTDDMNPSISDGAVKQKSADELFSEADNIINNGIDAAIKPIVDNPDLFRKVDGDNG